MASTIHSEIDYDKAGRQVGYLYLPQSPHSDAWGAIPIPIAVLNGGPGPTVLLTGGNHGDEYEGPITLGRLIRELDPAALQGRLIILPALNTPAVLAGQRLSPIDGKNFNRAFPGNPEGSATEQIAYYVDARAVPAWRMPSWTCIRAARPCRSWRARSSSRRTDPAQMARIVAAARAFDAPLTRDARQPRRSPHLDRRRRCAPA